MSFVCHDKFHERLENLSDREKKLIIFAIWEYGYEQKIPTFNSRVLNIVWNDIKEHMDYSKHRYENCVNNGKKGGRPKTKEITKEKTKEETKDITKEETKDITKDITKEKTKGITETKPFLNSYLLTLNSSTLNSSTKEREILTPPNGVVSKEKDGAPDRRFTPPTVDEVREYCEEKGYQVDPERFVNFYEAKGWMIGKNKMQKWKAAVANWARDKTSIGYSRKEEQLAKLLEDIRTDDESWGEMEVINDS